MIGLGIWDPNKPYIGHIKYLAQNIDEKDQLDFNSKIGLLGTPCCEMMGIALNNSSFIGNRYLKHFMKYNDVYWGISALILLFEKIKFMLTM